MPKGLKTSIIFKYSVCACPIKYQSSGSVLESIPKRFHKSPCACRILKNDQIL